MVLFALNFAVIFGRHSKEFIPSVGRELTALVSQLGHYVENTGDTDLVFLELFKASEVLDFSLNQWIRRLPPKMGCTCCCDARQISLSADKTRPLFQIAPEEPPATVSESASVCRTRSPLP